MKLQIQNIIQTATYKIILLCMLTIIPLIFSLFLKNVTWSYFASLILFLVFTVVYYNVKSSSNTEKKPRQNNTGLIETKVILSKALTNKRGKSLSKTMKNVETGVLIAEKIIIIKWAIDGKTRVLAKEIDVKLAKSLEQEPNLVSEPEKLYRKIESLEKESN